MRLHVVRHGNEEPSPTGGGSLRSADEESVSDRISPDHPSVDHPVITSATAPQTAPSPFRDADSRRPTPYESGLAAVARHDVHIERVWPMRSPSTGSLGESSSAYFQRERRGTPPASIVPVGGLRMNQAFPHDPVMATEVVGLFAPVPSGLILDATVGGGGHAAALLTAHGGVSVLGLDRDPAAAAAATAALAPFGHRAMIRQSRFDHL
ncbi:MAG TPA: 16S rRNA (cytosine(1402)-N(4))-methyltransferase, partial [Acidimicrobiales bacterium]|nr:16S rRNA (cytosine(1402)-N(4))-methyltransferase [Acidimicrobiales bacterium]